MGRARYPSWTSWGCVGGVGGAGAGEGVNFQGGARDQGRG